MGDKAAATTWLDVTDLLLYARAGNTTVSGIQRVLVNLVTHANLALGPVIPVSFEDGAMLATPLSAAIESVSRLQSGAQTPSIVKRDWADLSSKRQAVQPHPGDTLILPGAFSQLECFDQLARLRSEGVHIVLLVYDLIQIEHSDFVSPQAFRSALRSFVEIVPLVTSILTISEFVAEQVRSFLRDRMGFVLPVRAVPLPTELPAISATEVINPNVARIGKREFVLAVGTLETRKNQVYLVKVWSELRRLGTLSVPSLVLVGKWGNRGGELDRTIDELGCLNDWLFIVERASDADLDHLYRRCLLTSFPSFVEGWGLPVGESLARGKPCIASERSSIPEVGGSFLRLIDPYDVKDGVRVFEEVLRDRASLAAWGERIRNGFTPRSWTSYASEFYAAALQSSPSVAAKSLRCKPGRLYSLSTEALVRQYGSGGVLVPASSILESGWRLLGDECAWAEGQRSSLNLRCAADPNSDVLVYLQLRIARPAAGARLQVAVGSIETEIGEVPDGGFVRVPGRAEADGSLRIVIECCGGAARLVKERPTSFGLEAVSFCHAGNALERADILEEITLDLSRARANTRAAEQGEVAGALALRLLVDQTKSARPAWHPRSVLSLLFLWAAWRARRRGRWAAAEAYYRKMVQLGGLHPIHWVQLGHVLKEQGAFSAAAGAYQAALDRQPELSIAAANLQHCRRQLQGS